MNRFRSTLSQHRDLLLGLAVVAVVSALTLNAGGASVFADNTTSTNVTPKPKPGNVTAGLLPRLDCVQPDPDRLGAFIAAFGYEAAANLTTSVPVGQNNQVVLYDATGGHDLGFVGQPSEFVAGLHQYQFSVRFDRGEQVEWTLFDPTTGGSYKVAADEFVDTGCVVPGPQGPEGPQGPKGDQGPIGPQGFTGNQGPRGPAGNAGPAGPAGLEWRGPWDRTVIYSTRDAVSFDGSSWVAIGTPAGNVSPDMSPDWQRLAQRGDTGEKGDPGPQGKAGNQGPQGPQGPKGDQGDRGPEGPQGVAGNQGPQGPQGPAGPAGSVPSGTVIMILHGDAVPSGYTFVGSFDQKLDLPSARGKNDLKVTIDLYRKN